MALNSQLLTVQILTNVVQVLILCLSYSITTVAECACKDGYLPRFDEDSNILECIEELTQGHCKDGQKYSWDLDSEEPICLMEHSSRIIDITKGCEQEGYLPYFDENGKQQCYQEFSQVTFKLILLFFGC